MGIGGAEALPPSAPGLAEAGSFSPEPRRTRAFRAGVVMVVLACALLGGGTYALLASIRVFDVVFQGAGLISWPSVMVVAAGAILAFVALVLGAIAGWLGGRSGVVHPVYADRVIPTRHRL